MTTRPSPQHPHGPPGNRAGFVIYVALLTLLTAGAVGGFMVYSAFQHSRSVRRWHAADQCLLDAQSALERVKYELCRAYESNGQPSLAWFQAWTSNAIGSNPVYTIPDLPPIHDSEVRVAIAGVSVLTNAGYAEIVLVGAARAPAFAATRIISETLRVHAPAGGGDLVQPFEYAYLLNSSGTLRNNMVINGDIRINGNYRLSQQSIVNGGRYASGQLTANAPIWDLATYWAQAGPRARPSDPPVADGPEWPMGYVPDRTKNTSLPAFTIPPIDDLNALASAVSGRILRNGVEIVGNAYDGPGPDNLPGTADDGCLVLDGSTAAIAIQGAVVVKGDLIIRGTIGGQGEIYAGRNVHIVGALSYRDPPAWPKPDPDPAATAVLNAGKDLLVLGAKGNIVVGNYTAAAWSNQVWSTLAASASPYSVSASDAAIGYDSDNDPANGFLFDGRYTAVEAHGGRRLSGAGTNTVPRRYYESSLSPAAFSALCAADNVPRIDAALLTNHGLLGVLGSSAPNGNTELNGALACHDELDSFYGRFTINWDIRLGSQSRDRVKLASKVTGGPAADPATVSWRELP